MKSLFVILFRSLETLLGFAIGIALIFFALLEETWPKIIALSAFSAIFLLSFGFLDLDVKGSLILGTTLVFFGVLMFGFISLFSQYFNDPRNDIKYHQ